MTGSEPFAQPAGLAALLRGLNARSVHTIVYIGYALVALARRPEPDVRAALRSTGGLMDGPFVAALTAGAGPWRSSRNQRRIADTAVYLDDDECVPIVTMPE